MSIKCIWHKGNFRNIFRLIGRNEHKRNSLWGGKGDKNLLCAKFFRNCGYGERSFPADNLPEIKSVSAFFGAYIAFSAPEKSAAVKTVDNALGKHYFRAQLPAITEPFFKIFIGADFHSGEFGAKAGYKLFCCYLPRRLLSPPPYSRRLHASSTSSPAAP